jgi:hypothetical protein
MKTTRDIKMGLDVARNQNVPCRTIQIEEQIKKDLLGTRERFLSESEVEKIEKKEKLRIKNQIRAITKARVKILKQKERTRIVQAVRKGYSADKSSAAPSPSAKKARPAKEGFHAIDVSY